MREGSPSARKEAHIRSSSSAQGMFFFARIAESSCSHCSPALSAQFFAASSPTRLSSSIIFFSSSAFVLCGLHMNLCSYNNTFYEKSQEKACKKTATVLWRFQV